MRRPVIGLASTLSDERCSGVRLAGTDGSEFLVREGQDHWVSDRGDSEPVPTRRLVAAIEEGLGTKWDRAECILPGEKVVYAVERGAVRVLREPLGGPAGTEESEAADLAEVADALGIPRSRRRPKLEQAKLFSRIVEDALGGQAVGEIGLLDLACGRSYLGFVLTHRLMCRGYTVRLRGVDGEEALVAKCRAIADTLGWQNAEFETADLASYSVAPGSCDVAVALHACDTLTDDAIRIAWQARCRLLFVAPCCQHELRHGWAAHPLQWVSRYGLIEQRLADVLTDGFRCLVLEALGYRVKVLRFAAPEVTPKNLLIQAELTGGPRPERADEARAFMRRFHASPRLAALLDGP